jgi:hypothetical protein
MIAYLVLLLAILSRIFVLPHPEMLNFTVVGAGLLYFGARRDRWQIGIAVLTLAGTDYLLTVFHYSYPFLIQSYFITWIWYAGVALLGSTLLRKSTVLRVTVGVLTSATSFFLLSNAAFFVFGPGNAIYTKNLQGLMDCYAAGLPFYRNDLISTGLFAAVFFGLKPAVQWVSNLSHSSNQTAA